MCYSLPDLLEGGGGRGGGGGGGEGGGGGRGGGGGGGGGGRSRQVVDAEFLVDMFGSDFYTSEDAAQQQQERLEVTVQCMQMAA